MRVRVRKVALGLFHSVVLCEGGSVYGFGANPQIGAPKEVKYSTVPRLIEGGDLRDDDEDDEIEFIGCGSRHTLVASKRRAFAFGCNAKRQCGFAPPDANDEDDFEDEDEEERHNVYLPRETLSSSSATTIAFVRCERWSSFVGVVVQR
jgi:alpha-tubulin suppressor-like RCC1 family protein